MAGYESSLTVDCDRNGLGQDEAIGANKGRDATQLVELQVFGVGNGNASFNELDVQVVLLCND